MLFCLIIERHSRRFSRRSSRFTLSCRFFKTKSATPQRLSHSTSSVYCRPLWASRRSFWLFQLKGHPPPLPIHVKHLRSNLIAFFPRPYIYHSRPCSPAMNLEKGTETLSARASFEREKGSSWRDCLCIRERSACSTGANAPRTNRVEWWIW